jgi:hypothetical protein
MIDETYLTHAEAVEVDRALLSTHEKFLTRIAISSLRLLAQIATEEGVAIESLTPTQIITWFERDAAAKQAGGDGAGKLQW